MSTAERMYDDHRDRWRGPSMRIHPAWIILLVLGFIVWWPIGLAILAFTFWSKNMGCTSGDRWQRKMERMEEKMGRMRDRVERFGWHGFGLGLRPARAAITPSTSTAARRCADSKTSSASSATSSSGCASRRTSRSSTSSWPIGAAARRPRLLSRRADLPRSPAFSGPSAERRAARCFSMAREGRTVHFRPGNRGSLGRK